MNAAIDHSADLNFREKRRKYIGGSDIGALLGIAPASWRRNTPLALYLDKTQPPVVDTQNLGAKKRGKRWESVVGEMLVEELQAKGHQVEIVTANQRYIDPEFDFFACEIDFEIRLDGETDITNVELKTVHPFAAGDWGESMSDDMPVWYTAQCVWGLGITRRRRTILAPLFGADEIRTFEILADPEIIVPIRETARKFWVENVMAGVPPEPGNLIDMTLLFPKDCGATIEITDERIVDAIAELRAADELYDQAKVRWDGAEFILKEAMGAAAVATLGGKPVATWKTQTTNRFDQTAFGLVHPDLLASFKRPSESRVFRLSRLKK